jgi:hypothetical protein
MSSRRVHIRLCPTSLAAIPIRGEIVIRSSRIRAAWHRAEAAGDPGRADLARLNFLALGSLLGELTAILARHHDLHPRETESLRELIGLHQALGMGPATVIVGDKAEASVLGLE